MLRPLRRPRPACLLLAAIASIPVAAQAQVWRCESPGGGVEYSNNASSSRDARCRAVDLPNLTTIPAPKLPAQSGAAKGGAAATPSPAGFPRVDAGAQRARDLDRRRILEDELRKEEARLGELRAEFNGGEPERRGDERNYQRYLDRVQRLKDDIARSESSVASLKREMIPLRD
ncbi:MAG: DUF4124 domain-containing protein [Burkholderiales bacterium]